MDEALGNSHVELLDDDTIGINFAYHNGDETILVAKR